MSSTARAQRRGGISQLEFRAEMDRLGFVEVAARSGWLHEFRHPDTGTRRFGVRMQPPETFSAALARLCDVVRDERQWGRPYQPGVRTQRWHEG